MTVSLLWPWLVETCGVWGAILVVLLAILLAISWGVVPLGLWLLYRKSRTIDQQVQEFMLFKGEISRQQKVERLRRDKERTEEISRQQQAERLQHDKERTEERSRQQQAERLQRDKARPRRRR